MGAVWRISVPVHNDEGSLDNLCTGTLCGQSGGYLYQYTIMGAVSGVSVCPAVRPRHSVAMRRRRSERLAPLPCANIGWKKIPSPGSNTSHTRCVSSNSRSSSLVPEVSYASRNLGAHT